MGKKQYCINIDEKIWSEAKHNGTNMSKLLNDLLEEHVKFSTIGSIDRALNSMDGHKNELLKRKIRLISQGLGAKNLIATYQELKSEFFRIMHNMEELDPHYKDIQRHNWAQDKSIKLAAKQLDMPPLFIFDQLVEQWDQLKDEKP